METNNHKNKYLKDSNDFPILHEFYENTQPSSVYEIDPNTGLEINQPIEFYLKGVLLGKTFVSECSISNTRIKAAKSIGINYYDRFIIRPDSKMPADSSKVTIEGKPLNDFNNVNQ